MTMAKFINSNFLLENDLGTQVYSAIGQLPLIDYHNHLNPADLSSNRKFRNIADAWVLHDPYKHRAMRICGVPEKNITGGAGDKDKFLSWASTVPKTVGNPLFVWSALELKRIFGIDNPLSEKNADELWDFCNSELNKEGFGAADILKKFGAEVICTSDGVTDDLSCHQTATKTQQIKVLPSLRGDSTVNIGRQGFMEWLNGFEIQGNKPIRNLDDYKSCIIARLNKFTEAGCKLADHSLDSGFCFAPTTEKMAALIFNNLLRGKGLDKNEECLFENYFLHFLGEEYSKRGWTLQLHIGAQRFTSSRLRGLSGPAGGYATIGNSCNISGLCSFLDGLEKKGRLPRIILYTLNPSDFEPFATLTGSFAEDNKPGKIQFGPAWWYNDHFEGINKHLAKLSGYGLLSHFIGMTTDSRSVFSFSRHEYFRRILCNYIASMAEKGIIPDDFEMLVRLAGDISYFNSKRYLINQ